MGSNTNEADLRWADFWQDNRRCVLLARGRELHGMNPSGQGGLGSLFPWIFGFRFFISNSKQHKEACCFAKKMPLFVTSMKPASAFPLR
jgi:hypothetical protein